MVKDEDLNAMFEDEGRSFITYVGSVGADKGDKVRANCKISPWNIGIKFPLEWKDNRKCTYETYGGD